jgi:hypothetical protein
MMLLLLLPGLLRWMMHRHEIADIIIVVAMAVYVLIHKNI